MHCDLRYRRPLCSAWPAACFWGVKYSGPTFLVLLLSVFAIIVLSLRRSLGATFLWRSVLVVVLTVIATGAFWYLRNLILTGNPFYPLGTSIAGRTVFLGPGAGGDTLWDSVGTFQLRDAFTALVTGYGVFSGWQPAWRWYSSPGGMTDAS